MFEIGDRVTWFEWDDKLMRQTCVKGTIKQVKGASNLSEGYYYIVHSDEGTVEVGLLPRSLTPLTLLDELAEVSS